MNQLDREILIEIKGADFLFHVGDFTSKFVVDELIKLKKNKFKGVYGNADPLEIRQILPPRDIVIIEGLKIGMTHPARGGSQGDTKNKVYAEFKNDDVDAIVYGHTHDPGIEQFKGILFINPGKAYIEKQSFGPSASFAILNIDKNIRAKIKEISIS